MFNVVGVLLGKSKTKMNMWFSLVIMIILNFLKATNQDLLLTEQTTHQELRCNPFTNILQKRKITSVSLAFVAFTAEEIMLRFSVFSKQQNPEQRCYV
jgi:hypothetical protein